MNNYLLGISCFYHDSAAVLLNNGKILGAVQEERFTRKKHDSSFPNNSISYLLDEFNLSIKDINYVVFYEKPFLKFERLLETYVANAPLGFNSFRKAIPIWLSEKLFQKKFITNAIKAIDKNFDEKKLLFSEHHLSHAASAFYCSPYDEAIILTIDGVGEWATTTLAIGKNNNIEIMQEIHFPHSLGLLYSAFTYYLGFKVNSGEYKVMGLAPYGKPIYENLIFEKIVDVKEDGSFKLNQKYFNYSTGLTMTNRNFEKIFENKRRKSEDELEQFHMDIAASVQVVIEKIIIKIAKHAKQKYNVNNLTLAGGVALNCVANSKILKEKIFKNIWIQPASGDAGGALGASLAAWHIELKNERIIDDNFMKGSFLGPKFNNDLIKQELDSLGAKYSLETEKDLLEKTALELSKGKAIGWFQNRMEFGPRALGSRSIIADPRSEKMQTDLNLKIKFRESFRPFAPAIISEKCGEWFEFDNPSPYMLLTYDVIENKRLTNNKQENLSGIDLLNIKRSVVPAITHVDYSARVQTVHSETNPLFYNLLLEFEKITKCPILVNTSFNIRGEPIVCSPSDAFKCFMGTNLDLLVIGNFILYKEAQINNTNKNYIDEFDLD